MAAAKLPSNTERAIDDAANASESRNPDQTGKAIPSDQYANQWLKRKLSLP
jgi:hypothetical protein